MRTTNSIADTNFRVWVPLAGLHALSTSSVTNEPRVSVACRYALAIRSDYLRTWQAAQLQVISQVMKCHVLLYRSDALQAFFYWNS